MSNTAVQVKKHELSFAVTINQPNYQKLIASTIQNPAKCDRFKAAIISAVTVNPKLQECEVGSVLAGAFLGESLGLSPSPQLGHYYLVPYSKKAAFQIGYKGLIQLAVKSGMYKKIVVTEIKRGELVKYNPITNEMLFAPIEDFAEREAALTIGYYAKIELISGFTQEAYWSKEKAEAHGRRYSKGYSDFWGKHFDAMAKKTVLRELLGKWGVQSSEMVSYIESEDNPADYDGELPKLELAHEYADDNVEFAKNTPADENKTAPQPTPDDKSDEAPPLPEPPPNNKLNQLNFDEI
jgi:recombination protein RecT